MREKKPGIERYNTTERSIEIERQREKRESDKACICMCAFVITEWVEWKNRRLVAIVFFEKLFGDNVLVVSFVQALESGDG